MENLKPNAQRAKMAIALIWIILALEIISIVSGYLQYDLLQKAGNGIPISNEKANANDLREQIIAVVYIITFIISMITFIRWFRRAYFNLHLRVDYLFFTEGWAAGSWFVPIVSLYRPFQIMKELYKETKDLLISNGIFVKDNFGGVILGWWWTLWIINNLLGQFVLRYSRHADTIDELTISTMTSIIGNVIGIPLALITIKIIKDYAEVEPMLNELKDEEEISRHLLE